MKLMNLRLRKNTAFPNEENLSPPLLFDPPGNTYQHPKYNIASKLNN